MAIGPVVILPTLGDNFTYLLVANGCAVVIDPSEAQPVLTYLKKHSLQLKYVLNTHHHFDHVGGNYLLQKKTGCTVIGTDQMRTPAVDRVVTDNDEILFEGYTVHVFATPGHTPTSVSYMCTSTEMLHGRLFTGDTLFCGGCGRIMGSDPIVMWNSLNKLKALPDDTLVYPGHDYTEENYQFALSVYEDDAVLEYSRALCERDMCVPTRLSDEKQFNIFLRAGTQKVKKALGMDGEQDGTVFAKLRYMKDSF